MERRIKEGRVKAAEGDPEKEKEEQVDGLTAEERLARSAKTNISASTFCRFVASVKPAKLMPGQSGVMVVTALLNGQAVIPSPAPVEMIGATQQGLVTLGPISFRPADPGKLAPAYLGRPVYDNYAVFEIPVTMAADAQVGRKQVLNVDLRFDIYDGVSAQPIGRFIDRAATDVEVGQALDPEVQGGQGRDLRALDPTGEAGAVKAAGPEVPLVRPAVDRVISGEEVTASPKPDSSAATPPDHGLAEHDWSALEAGDSGLPLPVMVGGGVILLGLILLVARKR